MVIFRDGGGEKEQPSGNKSSDTEDLLVYFCVRREAVPSRSAERQRLTGRDGGSSPSCHSRQPRRHLTVTERGHWGQGQAQGGATCPVAPSPDQVQGPRPRALAEPCAAAASWAPTWLAPTKRQARNASADGSRSDRCWSTPGWWRYNKHSRQLATEALLQH